MDGAENGAFFFQTRMKFMTESFQKYDPNVCHLTKEVLQIVARNIGVERFNLNLFGVDILV